MNADVTVDRQARDKFKSISAMCVQLTEKKFNRLTDGILRLLKGKAVPLQAWTGPEASRKLRFPDFVTTAQDSGKVYPPEILLVLISVRG
jgi:hypothetical protein